MVPHTPFLTHEYRAGACLLSFHIFFLSVAIAALKHLLLCAPQQSLLRGGYITAVPVLTHQGFIKQYTPCSLAFERCKVKRSSYKSNLVLTGYVRGQISISCKANDSSNYFHLHTQKVTATEMYSSIGNMCIQPRIAVHLFSGARKHMSIKKTIKKFIS